MSRIRFAASVLLIAACNDATQPLDVPDAPQNVFVSARLNAIEISWTDVSRNEEVFVVEVATDDGPFLLLGNLPKNTTSTLFRDPQPGHTYRFRLSACNRAGCSAFLERSVNTDNWLKPTINTLNASTTGPAGVVVTISGGTFGMPVDVRVVLRRADDPQVYYERSERVSATAGETVFLKQYFFAGLEQGVSYFYEISLSNQFGTTVSVPQRVFVDFTRPQVIDVITSDLTQTSVAFSLILRPGGLDSSVFASVVPVDSAHAPSSTALAFVPGSPDGSLRTAVVRRATLQLNTNYKARFIVTNAAGSTTSTEVRFTTLP